MAFGFIKHKVQKKINEVVSTRVLGTVRDLNLSLIIIYSTYFTAFKVQLTFGVVPNHLSLYSWTLAEACKRCLGALSLKAQSYGFATTNSSSI